MNGFKILDTNILIYLSKNELTLSSFVEPGDTLYISVITYMEALGFPFKNKIEEKLISGLCENLIVLPLSESIVKHVIKLRKSHKIKLPDAIIAATAIENNCVLVTANEGDYRDLHVKLHNPYNP